MAKNDDKTGTDLTKAATGTELSADLAAEFAADAGAGTSQAADDNIVPFIVLLQDMSPEVKKRDPEYVNGAEVGMLLNKATRQLYAPNADEAEKTGLPQLVFQPCAFDRCIVEWVPRNSGGGFVARHELTGTPEATMLAIGGKQMEDPQDPKKKIWRTADGSHDLIDTRYHFGHVINEAGYSPAVLSFSSTGHTASREWMTLMNNFKVRTPAGDLVVAPSWSKKYVVGSKPKTNTKGDFFVISISDGGIIADKSVRDAGKTLNAGISSGAIKAAQDEATGAAKDGEMPI